MAKVSPWLTFLKNSCVFLLGRYPFIVALLLTMILSERADADKNVPPIYPQLIYMFIGLLVILGVGMSYDIRRKESCILFACQLGIMAYSLYTNDKLGYKPWLTNRLITRCFGLAGVYIVYGFLTSRNRSKTMQKVGEGLLAIYTMTSMFVLVNGPEDRDLFVTRIPFDTKSLFFLVTIMGACAMIYVNGGMFVTDASQAMMCINLALLLCLYSDMKFWVGKRGTPYWVQLKLICDDVAICTGLFLMAFAKIYWKDRLPKKDEFGNPYHYD